MIGTPLEKDWEAYRRHAAKSVRLVEEQLFPAVRARSEARTFNDLDDQIDEAVGQSVEALERLFVQFELRSDQARHQTTDGLRRVVGFGLALGLMNTIALLVGAFAIGRRVRATMEALQGGAKRLASGDLRISFPALQGRDEAIQVMGACQRMVEQWRSLVLSVRTEADRISAQATTISDGVQAVAEAAGSQRDSTGELSLAISELARAIQDIDVRVRQPAKEAVTLATTRRR